MEEVGVEGEDTAVEVVAVEGSQVGEATQEVEDRQGVCMRGVLVHVCEEDETNIPEGVMLCRSPYEVNPGSFVGCGQCLYCRINRARIWQHRMLLEELSHVKTSFATLTYNDENLPSDGNLEPLELQKFLKKLRRRYEPTKIRYFGVGEYGDLSWRPHYHLALFGVDYLDQTIVEETWSKGFTYLGDLTKESARYMSNYVTKGMTNCNVSALDGRIPEFARMSLKPGLGVPTIEKIAEKIKEHGECDGRVVSALFRGRKSMPLGKYLEDKLCELRGVTDVEKWYEGWIRQRIDSLEYANDRYHRSMEGKTEDEGSHVDYMGRTELAGLGKRSWYLEKSETERRTIAGKRRFLNKRRKL